MPAVHLRDGVVTSQHVDAVSVAAGSYQIRAGDDLDILMALNAEEDAGTVTTAIQEIRGKSVTSPEGYFEVVSRTTDGVAHAGVASVVISLGHGDRGDRVHGCDSAADGQHLH